MTKSPKAQRSAALTKHFWNFDIDNYINPICPRQRFDLLPNFVSFWFGYRSPKSRASQRLHNIGIWFSAAIGGFAGIAIITNVFLHLPTLGGHQVPLVIASFGAAAILEYNAIESPLSQPRNLIVGHFLSALVGVAVTKGFERLPAARFDELRWLCGSIAVGLASFVMGVTKTVHPPAGATALLAATNPEITMLGWWLLPLVLLAAVLMCASAQLVNNLTRRWPLYWWTPADLSKKKNPAAPITPAPGQQDLEKQSDSSETEVADGRTSTVSNSIAKWQRDYDDDESEGDPSTTPETAFDHHHHHQHHNKSKRDRDTPSTIPITMGTAAQQEQEQQPTITITADGISLPYGFWADIRRRSSSSGGGGSSIDDDAEDDNDGKEEETRKMMQTLESLRQMLVARRRREQASQLEY